MQRLHIGDNLVLCISVVHRQLEVDARAVGCPARPASNGEVGAARDPLRLAGRHLDDVELVTAGIYRLGQVMLRAGRNEEAAACHQTGSNRGRDGSA